MNKRILVLLLIVFLVMLVGCKTNSETSNIPEKTEEIQERVSILAEKISAIQVENDALIKENGILMEKNQKLAKQIQNIEAQNISLKGARDQVLKKNTLLAESSYVNASYHKELSFLKNELSYCALLPDIYKKNITNVFHPSLLKVGDQVAGLKVRDIEDEGFAKIVTFDGQFKVKLKVSKNDCYEEESYIFEVVPDYEDKVAKDIYNYSKNYHMTYDLNSSAQELIDEIGDAYYDGMEVTVVLDDYSISCDRCNYVNWAHFVKLISIG